MVNKLIKGTLLSILIFFSISFLTVISQINTPLNRMEENYELKIGFPFEYYHEFIVDCPIRNSAWNGTNLLLDCGLTWIITIALIIMINKKE